MGEGDPGSNFVGCLIVLGRECLLSIFQLHYLLSTIFFWLFSFGTGVYNCAGDVKEFPIRSYKIISSA